MEFWRFFSRAMEWDKCASGNNTWVLPGVQLDTSMIQGRISYAQEQAAQFRWMATRSSHILQNLNSYIEAKGVGVDLVPKGHLSAIVEDYDTKKTVSQHPFILDYNKDK